MNARAGGMALLEVLVAMAVLALGLVSAAALQVRAAQAFDGAWRESQALQLAQDMLEQARAAGQLSAAEAASWQARLVTQLGAAAQGRISHGDDTLVLEVHWPHTGRMQVLSLQGKVLP